MEKASQRGRDGRREHRFTSLRICEPLPRMLQPAVQAEAAISRRRECVMETFRGASLPEEGISHALGVG